METFVNILWSGVLIGIFVSAPMGPIGMLVIQRTMSKGRKPAFFTGIGAALSDLTYSLLTGLGLSFVTDFITTNELLLQILGSVVLLGFAFYLFRKNPTLALTTPQAAVESYWKDFVTGFLFTFANPLILFFIIGLLARFNFILCQQGAQPLQHAFAVDFQPRDCMYTGSDGPLWSLWRHHRLYQPT